MNTPNNHSGNDNTNSFLESLQYNSLFSNKIFQIDSKNNLHITDISVIKHRHEVVPLDMINSQPISEKRLNKPLMLLALASALASGAFFASAILFGQLWTIAFAMVFWIFAMGTLITSYINRTTVYQYHFAKTKTLLFSLPDSFSQSRQVEMFVNALNKKIININKECDSTNLKEEDDSIISFDITDEMEIYDQGKQSQYIRHLDFLFNHGIVDEALYKRLNKKIDKRISDSENRFIKAEPDAFDNQNTPNNIISFPIRNV